MIGQTVELRGTAFDSKAGAVLVTDDDQTVYIDGLDYWPGDLSGKSVIVNGLLRRKKYIPDPQTDADGAISQGAEGEQLVLEKAKWRAVK